jgi:hypothetical protein
MRSGRPFSPSHRQAARNWAAGISEFHSIQLNLTGMMFAFLASVAVNKWGDIPCLFFENQAMTLASLHELLVDQLKDLHSAETQLVKALPRIIKHASTPSLKEAGPPGRGCFVAANTK